jgi:hypothetical protein
MPLTFIFPPAAREPAQVKRVGLRHKKGWTSELERIQSGHPWMSDLRIWVESPTHVDHRDIARACGSYTRLAVTDVREMFRDADTDSCEKRPANNLLLNSSPLSYVMAAQPAVVWTDHVS